MADGPVAAATSPLERWGTWLFLAGVAALALGTVLAILGVSSAGFFQPGVYVLLAAMILLALSGILRVAAPEP